MACGVSSVAMFAFIQTKNVRPEIVLLFLSVSELIFLWVVIKSTVAITGVMMGISLIYNPCRLLRIGGCEGGRSVGGQVGGLGVQNYPHKLTQTLLLLTTQGQGGGDDDSGSHRSH